MTITKERLLKIQHWRETYGADSNVMLPAEEAEELARIALAALNDEPVAYNQVQRDMMKDIIVRKLGGNLLGHKLMMADIHAVTMALIQAGFRTAQPASERERIRHEHAEWSYADPVVFTDERNLRHIARGRETSLIWGKQNQEVGDIPLYRHAQPVPVGNEFIPKNLDKALGVVGVALPESKEEFNFQIERWIQRLIDRVIRYADEFKEQPAPVVPEEMNFSTACNFVQINGMAKEERATLAMRAWNACRAAMLQGVEQPQNARQNIPDGNSPVTQDGWISCSERMPDSKTGVLVAREFGRKGDWRMKWATYIPWHPDTNDGWLIPGASWKPSHWMPLPEPPQEEK
ncbi:DUF551 domain-containing protein [Salmonella enterica subsp. enterica]